MAKLRPRARIIRTIGDQLISGPEAAVIELVKNAYDADAESVLISFLPPTTGGNDGCIQICDDGHGMTHEDLLNRWFEPATDEKRRRKTSPNGRQLLGAKGIGRFAASRLGLTTKLRTWAASDDGVEMSSIEVNWEEFNADTFLDAIEIPTHHEKLPTRNSRPGTEISISRLRDTWTKPRFERLIRELRRVASPAPDDGNGFSIRLDLTNLSEENAGFDGHKLLLEQNFSLSADSNAAEDPTLIVPYRINDHADYCLKGSFDSQGNFSGTFVNHRADGESQPLQLQAPPMMDGIEACGPIDLHLNVYDREHAAVEALFERMGLRFSDIGIRAARRIISENSGISIFRSGFRIRPYGDSDNDWLELESQRVQNPSRKLGLSQVSGVVSVASEEGSGLIERSSREGLEHNGSFLRLKQLMREVLTHVEERRLAFRERTGLSRRASGDVETTRTLATLPTVRRVAEQAPSSFRPSLDAAIEKDSSALSKSLEEIDAYQTLLQSRAALGLVVAQVIHEARRILNPLSTASRALNTDAHHLLENSKMGDVVRRHLPQHLETITSCSKQLSELVKRLDPISGRRRGNPKEFSVLHTIKGSVAFFADSIQSQRIKVHLPDHDADVFGFPEDLQSALMNLLENAIHWIGTQESDERSIRFTLHESRSSVQLKVTNSGPIIDPTYVPRLFQAGFSLKSSGTGLGLAIAREACRASKGELSYDEESRETSFIITLRKPDT